MPSVSNAQRKFLFATKGASWTRKHGFDTKGKLPEHKRSMRRTGRK